MNNCTSATKSFMQSVFECALSSKLWVSLRCVMFRHFLSHSNRKKRIRSAILNQSYKTFFAALLMPWRNKLECLTVQDISNTGQILRVRKEPT
jgi:hypothetical protein